eukprot:c7910_g1_i1 orf=360-1085(-)
MSSPYNMQQQHSSQSLSGGPHPPIASVTTELIQKYLDENKQLILAILDNQNLGKLNECAVFQQKLQSNLMFLAAVADAQTQPAPVHGQPPTHRPPGVQYMTHSQAQKQMPPQSMLRSSIQYTPHEVAALQQAKLQQHSQQGMHGQGAGGHVFQMNPVEASMPLNSLMSSRGYPGGGIPEHIQLNRGPSSVEMRIGNRTALDMGVGSGEGGGQLGSANGNAGSGLGGDLGQSYSKPANDGDN